MEGKKRLTCSHLFAFLQLVGHMLGQRGVKQGLCFLLFYGQLLGKDTQLLLLLLQLGGQLNLSQSLLVQQDEIPGGVMGGDV